MGNCFSGYFLSKLIDSHNNNFIIKRYLKLLTVANCFIEKLSYCYHTEGYLNLLGFSYLHFGLRLMEMNHKYFLNESTLLKSLPLLQRFIVASEALHGNIFFEVNGKNLHSVKPTRLFYFRDRNSFPIICSRP